VRPDPQHREDRALARVLQSVPGGLRAAAGTVGETRACSHGAVVERVGQTAQELREDRPRVAPRPVESGVGGQTAASPMRLGAPAPSLADARPQRRCEIGAGVGVGHRKDIDAVEVVAFAHHGKRARVQRWAKPLPSRLRTVWLKA